MKMWECFVSCTYALRYYDIQKIRWHQNFELQYDFTTSILLNTKLEASVKSGIGAPLVNFHY